jgi:hypothetical protein
MASVKKSTLVMPLGNGTSQPLPRACRHVVKATVLRFVRYQAFLMDRNERGVLVRPAI